MINKIVALVSTLLALFCLSCATDTPQVSEQEAKFRSEALTVPQGDALALAIGAAGVSLMLRDGRVVDEWQAAGLRVLNRSDEPALAFARRFNALPDVMRTRLLVQALRDGAASEFNSDTLANLRDTHALLAIALEMRVVAANGKVRRCSSKPGRNCTLPSSFRYVTATKCAESLSRVPSACSCSCE